MKKILNILYLMFATCCMAFAFAGCNGTPENGGNDNLPTNNTGKDYCIVYFSYSGNTKSVANEIISQINGVGVEIVPAIPYTAEELIGIGSFRRATPIIDNLHHIQVMRL